MINGVLVERTVKDILPALKTNSDGLKQVLDQLMKQYKTKQDEMDGWKVCSTPITLSITISEMLSGVPWLTSRLFAEEEQRASCAKSIMRSVVLDGKYPCVGLSIPQYPC
jgi:Prefoldin subunit